MQQITNGPLWLAAAGVTSDYDNRLLDAFREAHPQLAPNTNDVEEALFNSPLGTIIRTLNFSLKGRSSDITKNLRALTKIRAPQELLEANTPASKQLAKHTKPLLKEYERQLQEAITSDEKNPLFIHVFSDIQQSFVADVANELLRITDAEIILVARKDVHRVNLSLRSHDTNLQPLLEEALQGIDGYGGGHENACGGSIATPDWTRFLEAFTQRVHEQL